MSNLMSNLKPPLIWRWCSVQIRLELRMQFFSLFLLFDVRVSGTVSERVHDSLVSFVFVRLVRLNRLPRSLRNYPLLGPGPSLAALCPLRNVESLGYRGPASHM